MNTSELIYDWNKNFPASLLPPGPVLLNDESLRDGLQSPSVRDPSIPEKIEILHLMEALGINALDLGLPGAGPRAVDAVTALAREIVSNKMKIQPNCAARTHENDIRPIAEIVQKTGLRIEAATFIGSSPIRRFTEGWTDDFLVQTTEKAVKYAVSLGLDVMYFTEDTSRCDPETVKRLYATAINRGARAICIRDTAGHATPTAARPRVRFTMQDVLTPPTATISEGCLDLETVDSELQAYLAAYQRFLQESGFRPELIEHRLVRRVAGVLCGGTVDRVGSMNGRLWLIDLKCVDRLYPGFALQTAGY